MWEFLPKSLQNSVLVFLLVIFNLTGRSLIAWKIVCQNNSTECAGEFCNAKLANSNETLSNWENFEVKNSNHFLRNLVGVVLSPYDRLWENNTITKWNDYSNDEMRNILEMVSTKFTSVATWGIGTKTNTSSWADSDKIGLLPYLAAEYNRESNKTQITMSVGIFRKDNSIWLSKEMYNAIDAAEYANNIYPGTVWGLTVTSNFVNDQLNADYAIDMIREVKRINQKRNLNLEIGIRLKNCEMVIEPNQSEDNLHLYSLTSSTSTPSSDFETSLQSALKRVAYVSDFILCEIKPSSGLIKRFGDYVEKVVERMGEIFLKIRQPFQKINPNITVIVETGWPSQGESDNGSKNNLKNLRDYWFYMAKWSERHCFKIHLFEAVDQPWKNDQSILDEMSSRGVNGSDAYYGWWRRVNNSEPGIYIEKITEITPEMENVEGSNENIIALATGAVLSVAVCITLYLLWRLKEARNVQIISQKYLEIFHKGCLEEGTKNRNYETLALQFPYNRSYELSKDKFQLDKSVVIGRGESGVVYKGKIVGVENAVAFKTTNMNSSLADLKHLLSEIKIMSYIGKHDNVVCLLGAYTGKIESGIVYMALEYCPLGSLDKFLTNQRQNFYVKISNCVGSCSGYVNASFTEDLIVPVYLNKRFEVADLIKWSYEIANGMDFLASKKVIHADLASRNVLLTVNESIKITDFGLSRKLYQEISETRADPEERLPWRWLAPESLRYLTFSTETDIWAFGVTIWEIFALGEIPYMGITWSNDFVTELENGVRLDAPKNASSEIFATMQKCWDIVPSRRPNFRELKIFFRDLL